MLYKYKKILMETSSKTLCNSNIRVLLDKLIVAKLVSKYPTLLLNPDAHYRVHNSSPLDSLLSQFDPVHIFILSFFKFHFNIILPDTLKFPSGLLLSGHPTIILYELSNLQFVLYVQLISSSFILLP
jgi:hypothetical protein